MNNEDAAQFVMDRLRDLMTNTIAPTMATTASSLGVLKLHVEEVLKELVGAGGNWSDHVDLTLTPDGTKAHVGLTAKTALGASIIKQMIGLGAGGFPTLEPGRYDWLDIGFTVVLKRVNDAVMDFKAYRIRNEPLDTGDLPMFERRGGVAGVDTSAVSEAEVFLDGHVKWDQCSNLHFQDSIHLCARSEVKDVAKLLDRLYEAASRMLPMYDRSE